MSFPHPVLWREGLFVKPQHFQQLVRASEAALHQRVSSLQAAFYGFTHLQLSQEYLALGKLVITQARGIMPDGTAFDMPADLPCPAPLAFDDSSAQGCVVYLCLPLRSGGAQEVAGEAGQPHYRYLAQPFEVIDTHSEQADRATVDLALPNFQLKREHDDSNACTRLAIGRVLEQRADGALVLDERFYPTAVSIEAIPALKRFLDETTHTLRERARHLAAHISSPGQSAGVADIHAFNLLQAMNRWWPCFNHLARQPHTHPEALYLALSQACGELLTFTEQSRLPADYPAYQHIALHQCFQPLEQALRRSLSIVLQPRAIALRLEQRTYGVKAAVLDDRRLLESAAFILAVSASVPVETLRRQFIQKAKVTSVEALSELVPLQLPGIPLLALPVAPRELPFHAGYSYFELDRQDPAWQVMSDSSGFGLHIAGDFPDLDLQFWAIRSE